MQTPEKRTLRRMLGYMMRYKFRIMAGVFFSFIVSIANLFSLTAMVPIFNAIGSTDEFVLFTLTKDEKNLYERYQKRETLAVEDEVKSYLVRGKIWGNEMTEGKGADEVVILISFIILPVYFFKLICLTIAIYFVGTAGYLAVRDMRMDLYRNMNHLGMDYFTRERTGLIMSRIINDVEIVGKTLSMEFHESIVNIFYIITHFAFLLFISIKFLLVVIFVVPILMSPVNKFSIYIRKASRKQQEMLAELGAHIQEILSGIRVIRAFSMENFEKERFDIVNEGLYENTFKKHYFHQVGPALTEMVASFIIVFFISWGAYEITNGAMSKGLFFIFFFTLVFLMRPVRLVSIAFNILSSSLVAADRIFEMIDMPPGVKDGESPVRMQDFKSTISFNNVSFKYPVASDKNTLENIDFKVNKGQMVSLVGSSGAGKSTMMDLLLRFYDTSEGSVEIDGVDIRNIKLKDLRNSIGIVTQNIFLFNASVKENIAYGRSDISMERIIEVAKAANAHEFIDNLPEGYDTPVGERGVMLSGGQKQRLVIARALLLDPPILIFDEATSNLDNESERLVQEALERLLKGRTVFIIAHRLSSVYKSDEILVMDKGRIAERGTHSDLLSSDGIYRKLYEMQFAEA